MRPIHSVFPGPSCGSVTPRIELSSICFRCHRFSSQIRHFNLSFLQKVRLRGEHEMGLEGDETFWASFFF